MKYMRYLALSSILALASPLMAKDFCHQRFQLNVGPVFNYAQFKLGCLQTFRGYLAGVHADFYYSKPRCLYTGIRFDARFNAPDLYSKGDCCEMSCTRATVRDYIGEWNLGYVFESSNQRFTGAPFAGIGLYYLSPELQPDIIRYKYYNLFVPLGVDLNWMLKEDKLYLGLHAEYRLDARTRLKVKTPCLEICECDKLKLCKRTQGFLIELPIKWILSWRDSVNLQTKVVPFFDWNRFSNTKETSSECIQVPVPRLKRWYAGLRVDLGIRF